MRAELIANTLTHLAHDAEEVMSIAPSRPTVK